MLQFEELSRQLSGQRQALTELGDSLGLERLREEVEMLELKSAEPGFWDDMANAQKVTQRMAGLKAKDESYQKLCSRCEDAAALIELGDEAEDLSLIEEIQAEIDGVAGEIANMKLSTLLTGEYDAHNAILTFHAGSGGTEAQDWAEMLFRMYGRWAERRGFKVTTLDYLDGDEAGLKSASILVEGENAYGYLKSEAGVHRLVRVSPFDAAGRRHTSFSSLEVMPEIEEVPGLRRRRAEGEQDLLRCAADSHPHRHCGQLPGGAQPVPEPGRGHENAHLEAGGDKGAGEPGEDIGHKGRAEGDNLGQPDTLLRVHALYNGEGPPHRLRDRQRERRHGRRPGRLHKRLSHRQESGDPWGEYRMNFELTPIKEYEKEILRNLMEKYDYEFTQYTHEDVNPLGLYGYSWLDAYWRDPAAGPSS